MAARPHLGFVGLQNGGATCYMNSVIQQLYMQPGVREVFSAVYILTNIVVCISFIFFVDKVLNHYY